MLFLHTVGAPTLAGRRGKGAESAPRADLFFPPSTLCEWGVSGGRVLAGSSLAKPAVVTVPVWG